MKWLYKLEHKFGKYYIQRLMMIIVAGMALVYVAQIMIPTLPLVGTGSLLSLNRAAILSGQVWRLVTFVFVPPNTSAIFVFISLYFYYIIGSSLENNWGGFRFNMYYLIGMVGAIIACMITGRADNYYLNLSLFLAFATLAPDTQFMLFFVLPIKAKWMALAYAALSILQIVGQFVISPQYGVVALVAFAFSVVNYLLFFGRDMIDIFGNEIRVWRNRRNWNNRNR